MFSSVICWIVVVRTLVHLLWLYIIDDEGVIYYRPTCVQWVHIC